MPRRADVRALVVAVDRSGNRSVHVHTTGLAEHLSSTGAQVTVRHDRSRGGGTAATFDLVIGVIPGLRGAVGASRIAQRHGAPLVLVVHDLVSAHPQGRYGPRNLRYAEATERRLMTRATSVAVATTDLDVVVRALGVPPERVHLLPSWAPPAQDIDRPTARRALGWPARRFVVVHPIGPDSRHDLASVLAARCLLGDGIELVLVGDGARRAAAAVAHDPGGPAPRVITPTDEAEYRRMLACADLLLLAQRPETTGPVVPRVLIDALAARRPLVAAVPADSGVAAELDRAAGAGLVVPAADPGAIAGAVRALQLDAGQRTAMSAAAARYVAERLDRATTMARLDRIVDGALPDRVVGDTPAAPDRPAGVRRPTRQG